MNLTYRELAAKLAKMDDQELDMNVTVYVRDQDEYLPIESCKSVGDLCDVLDEGHPCLYTSKNE